MKAWLEISSDFRFQRKLENERGLYAPLRKRYRTMMNDIKPGDLILHYITSSGALDKDHRSAIVGVSIAKSELIEKGTNFTVMIDDIIKLPKPVSILEIKKSKDKSDKLKTIISMSFQRYLAELELSDARKILSIHDKNMVLLKEVKSYRVLF